MGKKDMLGSGKKQPLESSDQQKCIVWNVEKIWLNKSSSEVAMVIVNVWFPILFNSIHPLLQERNNSDFSTGPNDTGDSYLKMRTECTARRSQTHDLQGT